MESEQSRPFFNPEEGKPYDLRELPSGSEVSYGAEWGNHRLDGDGYCEVCDAYGLNCIEQGGNSPESIAAVEEAIRNLENSLQSLKEAGVTDMRELKSAIKQAKLKMYSMMNENRCTCDREYGEADPDCMACLNEWRNQRYGPDVHDVECVCNECVPLGRYSSYAESYEAESKPRLSEKQLWSLNVMKTMYYWHDGTAYVEVDNRGHKTFTSRPVQGLLNKGLIEIPRDRIRNPRFWGRVESYEAYNVDLTPLAWEYDYTWPWPSHYSIKNSSNIRQEGNKMVSDAETFSAEVTCANCGIATDVENTIPCMTVANHGVCDKRTCDNCGCDSCYFCSQPMCDKHSWIYDSKTDVVAKWGKVDWVGDGNVCQSCVEETPITQVAESFGAKESSKAEGKVRTMSGKPHTPRKLVKDKNITPKDASKKLKLDAESFSADEETVVDKTEESGITTETRQYKKKKYNPDKMKTDIPADVLNQTDSDDFWVAFSAGILGIGIGASIHKVYETYGNPFKGN